MPETATHQRFRSRMEYIMQHHQVVDLAMTVLFRQTSKRKQDGGTILDAFDVHSTRYDRLNHPVTHDARIFNFSRSRNAEHALVSLHRHFSEFMRGMLEEMYTCNPLLVVGKGQGVLQYHEIVKLGSIEAINDKMIDEVFRKLENEKSTGKLVEKVLAQTTVHLDPVQLQTALMYLELRHLIVHNGGIIDETFEAKFGEHLSLQNGDKVPLKARTVQDAVKAVAIIAKDIDTQLIAGSFAVGR